MHTIVLNMKFPNIDYIRYNPEDGTVQEICATTCDRLQHIHKIDVESYRAKHGELHPTISLDRIGFWFGKSHSYREPLV